MPGEAGAPGSRSWLSPALRRAVWFGLFALCALYFLNQIVAYRAELATLASSANAVRGVLVAALVLAISTLIDGWGWGVLLRTLGVSARSSTAIGIFSVAQLGKYVPGNVAHHAGRIGLGKEAGFQAGRVVMSLLVENGFALGAGALVGGLGLLLLGGRDVGPVALWAPLALVLGFALGVVLLRRWFARPPRFIARWLALDEPVELPRGSLAGYFALHLLSYGLLGCGLALLLVFLGREWGPWVFDLPLVIAASFLVRIPGAPAGLGVRETVMTTLLTPLLGPAVAVSATVLFRIAAMLADGAVFLVGVLLRARRSA